MSKRSSNIGSIQSSPKCMKTTGAATKSLHINSTELLGQHSSFLASTKTSGRNVAGRALRDVGATSTTDRGRNAFRANYVIEVQRPLAPTPGPAPGTNPVPGVIGSGPANSRYDWTQEKQKRRRIAQVHAVVCRSVLRKSAGLGCEQGLIHAKTLETKSGPQCKA